MKTWTLSAHRLFVPAPLFLVQLSAPFDSYTAAAGMCWRALCHTAHQVAGTLVVGSRLVTVSGSCPRSLQVHQAHEAVA